MIFTITGHFDRLCWHKLTFAFFRQQCLLHDCLRVCISLLCVFDVQFPLMRTSILHSQPDQFLPFLYQVLGHHLLEQLLKRFVVKIILRLIVALDLVVYNHVIIIEGGVHAGGHFDFI